MKAFEEWIESEYAGESDDGKEAVRTLYRPIWQAALRRAAEICRDVPCHFDQERIAQAIEREARGE